MTVLLWKELCMKTNNHFVQQIRLSVKFSNWKKIKYLENLGGNEMFGGDMWVTDKYKPMGTNL